MPTGMPSTSQKIQKLLEFHIKRVDALTLTLELLEGTERIKKANGHNNIIAQALRQEQGRRIGRPPLPDHDEGMDPAAMEDVPPNETKEHRKARKDRERKKQATIARHKATAPKRAAARVAPAKKRAPTAADIKLQRLQSVETLKWFAEHPGANVRQYRETSGHGANAWRGIGSMLRYNYLKPSGEGFARTTKHFNP